MSGERYIISNLESLIDTTVNNVRKCVYDCGDKLSSISASMRTDIIQNGYSRKYGITQWEKIINEINKIDPLYRNCLEQFFSNLDGFSLNPASKESITASLVKLNDKWKNRFLEEPLDDRGGSQLFDDINRGAEVFTSTTWGAVGGAVIGSILPIIGTTIGAAIGGATSFAASFNANRKERNKEIADRIDSVIRRLREDLLDVALSQLYVDIEQTISLPETLTVYSMQVKINLYRGAYVDNLDNVLCDLQNLFNFDDIEKLKSRKNYSITTSEEIKSLLQKQRIKFLSIYLSFTLGEISITELVRIYPRSDKLEFEERAFKAKNALRAKYQEIKEAYFLIIDAFDSN